MCQQVRTQITHYDHAVITARARIMPMLVCKMAGIDCLNKLDQKIQKLQ